MDFVGIAEAHVTTDDAAAFVPPLPDASSVPPAAPPPHVARCANVLRDRSGIDLSLASVERLLGGDPGFVDRLREYPRTGTLDALDTCDRDRLRDLVCLAYAGSPWDASVARGGHAKRLVAAVIAAGDWA